jgi:DNA replication protein DnaC
VNAAPQALPEMLGRLKLGAMRDRLDSLLDEAARRELSLREALQLLCEAEVARREERRIQMAMGIAKFPFVRNLDGFEFEAQPSLDPRHVRDLAACRWVANGDALLLLGPPVERGWGPVRPARPIWRSRSAARRSGRATRSCSCRPSG